MSVEFLVVPSFYPPSPLSLFGSTVFVTNFLFLTFSFLVRPFVFIATHPAAGIRSFFIDASGSPVCHFHFVDPWCKSFFLRDVGFCPIVEVFKLFLSINSSVFYLKVSGRRAARCLLMFSFFSEETWKSTLNPCISVGSLLGLCLWSRKRGKIICEG